MELNPGSKDFEKLSPQEFLDTVSENTTFKEVAPTNSASPSEKATPTEHSFANRFPFYPDANLKEIPDEERNRRIHRLFTAYQAFGGNEKIEDTASPGNSTN